MIVTEEEAKTKRCQESFGPVSPVTLTTTMMPQPFGHQINQPMALMPTNCIGSACMAWRWQDSLSPEQQRGAYGFCGKAGKP